MEYVAAAMAVVGAVSSVVGGSKANKTAGKAGRTEARLEQVVTRAKVEGLEAQQRELKGQTIQGAAGSGVEADTGSPVDLLVEQAKNFAKEILVTKQTGATRSNQATTRADMIGKQAQYQGFSQGASGMANAFMMMKTA